jgi:hypothetical protein
MSDSTEATSAGFDLSLIAENLRLSPEERVLQHERALALRLEFARAGNEFRDKTRPAAPAPADD